MSRLRVATIADPKSPNVWYRGMGPSIALAHRGHEVRQVWKPDGSFQAQPVGRRMLAGATVVTTPSARLAEQFRAAGAGDVRILENYVPDASLGVRPVRHDGVVVGWIAGREHRIDVDRLPLAAVLTELLAAHPSLRVTTIGVGLGLSDPRYRHIPRIRFDELAEHVAEFDIGIAPLADIAFNQSRSNVKLKEYAVVGVPWLASPVGAYVGMGERQGGLLVGDDGWPAAVERLLLRERERRKLAKRATRWGATQTVSHHIDQWERVLLDAVARGRPRALARV